jgi:hypothetical protein
VGHVPGGVWNQSTGVLLLVSLEARVGIEQTPGQSEMDCWGRATRPAGATSCQALVRGRILPGVEGSYVPMFLCWWRSFLRRLERKLPRSAACLFCGESVGGGTWSYSAGVEGSYVPMLVAIVLEAS